MGQKTDLTLHQVQSKLTLESLKTEHPGLTTHFGGMLAETCAICLDQQGHSSGTRLNSDGIRKQNFSVVWTFAVTETMQKCYRDAEFATENGAYALAILILQDLTGFKVVERSRKGNGFDFYLGQHEGNLFQNKVRLEVSGIRNGDNIIVSRRMKEKLDRLKKYDSLLPAYVAIVEFGQPFAKVIKHDEN
ncbi:MAG: hypothetical protein AB1744_01765 [Candidatus Zixiibacteriota bacterium]